MESKRSVKEYLVGWAVTGIVAALAGALGWGIVRGVAGILMGNFSCGAVVIPLLGLIVLGIGCPPYGGAILGGSVLGGLLGGWGFTTLFRGRGRLGAVIGGIAVAAFSAVYFESLLGRCGIYF